MKFKNYKVNHKWLYVLSVFLTGLSLPMRAFAGFSDIAKTLIGYLGEIIWAIVIQPIAFIIGLEIELLRFVAKYNNFVHETGVLTGWIALRDLSNMFFILILLVIAFATILGISNYGYQQLLKRTIIIAILINFSKTIVGFLIDIVQVVMLTFIAAVDNALSGELVVALGLTGMMSSGAGAINVADVTGDAAQEAARSTGIADYILPLILAVVFLLILVVLIGVMLMMLVMRVVSLWVLIVLSPLAFLSNIFPYTRPFFGKWSKELGSNLIAGPMLAFFLWLTLTIVGNGEIHKQFITDGSGSTGGGADFLHASSMINYIIAIALLIVGIKEAASSGAAGASFASKGMGKIQSAASGAARQLKRPGAAAAGAAGAYAKGVGLRARAGATRAFINKVGGAKFSPSGKLDKTDDPTKFSRINDMRDSQDSGFRAFGNKMTGKALAGARDSRAMNKVRNTKWEQTAVGSQIYKKGLEWRGAEQRYSKEESDKAVAGVRTDEKGVALAQRAGLGGMALAGGDKFAKNEDAKARHAAGKIRSSEDGQAARKIADNANDKQFQRELGASHPNTLKNEEEAARIIQKEGIGKALSGLSGKQVDGDDKDNPKINHLFKAALEAQEGPALADHINKLPEDEQRKVAEAFKKFETKTKGEGSVAAKNLDGSIKMRNGTAVFNDRNIANQAGNVLAHISPGDALYAKNKRATSLSEEAAEETTGLERKIATLKGRKTRFKKAGETDKVDETNEEIKKHKERIKELEPIVTEGGAKKAVYDDAAIKAHAQEQLGDKPIAPAPGVPRPVTDDEINARVVLPTDTEINAKVKQPTDTEINASLKAKGKSISYTSGGGYSSADIDDEKEKMVEQRRGVAEQDILTDKRNIAEQDILTERQATEDTEQEEAMDKFDAANDVYNDDLTELVSKMTKAVEDINVDMQDQKSPIQVDLKAAKAAGDTSKADKLMAQLVNLTRLQNIKLAGALGKSGASSSAVVKSMAKNMDYSNLSEMDIHIPEVKHLFEQFAKVASPNQQKQLFETANPKQLEVFARAVVNNGQRLTKMLREILPHHVGDELYAKEKARKS